MPPETPKETCPNCGQSIQESDHYCPSCGQKQEEVILTFKEMVLDALGAFFSFDSKALRSIPKLLFSPGSLTLEYVRGKRQHYLAPFRFYLFVSIVLFLLLPLIIKDQQLFKPTDIPTALIADSTALEQSAVDSLVDSMQQALNLTEDSVDAPIRTSSGRNFNFSVSRDNPSPISFGSSDSSDLSLWSVAVALSEEGMPVPEVVDSIFPNQQPIIKKFIGQGIKLQVRGGEGLTSEFLNTTSYTLFIFLPLFALVLKLLYIRRKRFYMEHLVFSLHYFTFFFILICLYVLIYRFAFHFPFWVVWAVVAAYLYAAMFRFYQQGWGRTLLKWLTLNFTTTVIFLPFFFVIALIVSLLFY